MIKKVLTYTDIDGHEQTEEHYFHLGMDQITNLEERHPEGIIAFFKGIVSEESSTQSLVKMRELLTLAHGFRPEGTSEFERDEERTKKFMRSLAYDSLWVSLIGDDKAQEEFFAGLLPSGMSAKAQALTQRPALSAVPSEEPAWIRENRDPTNLELRAMSQAELIEVFRRRTQMKPEEDQ